MKIWIIIGFVSVIVLTTLLVLFVFPQSKVAEYMNGLLDTGYQNGSCASAKYFGDANGFTCGIKNLYHFLHKNPANYYIAMVKEFGEPSIIVDKPNGLVIWQKPQFFEQLMIKDESISHMVPNPHCDFLYATINVYIPPSLIPSVLAISQSVYYDNLKRELTIRCNSINSVVAALRLAMSIINDPEHSKQLGDEYSKMVIMARDPINYRNMYDELKIMVLNNQKMYAQFMANTACADPIDKNLIRRLPVLDTC